MRWGKKSFTKIYKLYCKSTNSNNVHKHRHNSPSFSCCVRFGCLWFISASEYKWRRHIKFLSHKPVQRHLFLNKKNATIEHPVACLLQTDYFRLKHLQFATYFRSYFSLNIKIYEALRESICLYLPARKCSLIFCLTCENLFFCLDLLFKSKIFGPLITRRRICCKQGDLDFGALQTKHFK